MFKPTDVLAQVLVALAETIRELDESPRQNQPPEPFLDRFDRHLETFFELSRDSDPMLARGLRLFQERLHEEIDRQ